VLRPKVVQVQTIVRPKALNLAAQNAQAQNGQAQSAQAPNSHASGTQPSAPVQSAALQVAAAPAAAPVVTSAETKSTEIKSSDLQLPQSPPLPRPAQRPEVAAVQTVARAPDAEQVWPPALTPEQPAVAFLPMPKPRPAKAPKALAKLDVTGQDVTKQDAVASDVVVTDQSSVERSEPAASAETQIAKLDPQAVPLPQPRPEVDETPERESKSTHRGSRHRHFRSARAKKPETPALIALFQKLTTPAQPTRRRR
jgi:hypothetical protein